VLDVERGAEKLSSEARFDAPKDLRLDLAAAVELVEQGQGIPRGFGRSPGEHLNGAKECILVTSPSGESFQPDLCDIEIAIRAAVGRDRFRGHAS
jgi:hypothetical protein